MADRTRTEHLAWCKGRALALLPDEVAAFSSMASDLSKHAETEGHIGIGLGMQLMMTDNLHDMRRYIEGFN